MGFFSRLSDFGDREQVKTIAMKIDVGIQQLEKETSPQIIKGLSFAVKEEVDRMFILASRLTMKSLASLEVRYKGTKISYFTFLSKISDVSKRVVDKGGYSLIQH